MSFKPELPESEQMHVQQERRQQSWKQRLNYRLREMMMKIEGQT
jgi:hypothetical protein